MKRLYFVTYLYGKLRIFNNCYQADSSLILFEDSKRMSVNIYNKKSGRTAVNRVNSCFSVPSPLKYQKSTTLTP